MRRLLLPLLACLFAAPALAQPCAPTNGVPCATKMDFKGLLNIIGSAGGSLTNTGISTLSATTATTLTTSAALTANSTLTAAGILTANGQLIANGTLTANSTLTAAGAFNDTGGIANIGSNTFSSPALNINGAAGTVRGLFFKTAGVNRWRLSAEGTAESGSNAGSLLSLFAFSDAGSSLGELVRMSRVDGSISINAANNAAYTLGTFTSNLASHNFSKGQITQNGARVWVPGFALDTVQNPGVFQAIQTWTGTLGNFPGGVEPWYYNINDTVDASGLGYTLIPFNVSHNFTATAVPVAGGTGYHVNDIVTDPSGNEWTVTSINAGVNSIKTLFITAAGTGIPAPASAVTGGAGTGATITVTGGDGNRSTGLFSYAKTAPSISGNKTHVMFGALGTFQAGEGGGPPDVDGTLHYKGAYKGMNLDVRANEKADWVNQLQLGEFDIALTAGLHALSIVGVNVNYAFNHGAEGALENAAWVVTRGPSATAGTTYALQIGSQTSLGPFMDSNPNTAIIGVGRNFDGAGGHPINYRMQRIIDGRHIDPLTNAWESAGFKIGKTGALGIGPGVISFDATNGVKIASPGVVATSAVVNTGGALYIVDDTIWDTEFNAWRVATVGGGGVLLTVDLLHASATGTCPAPASPTTGGTGDIPVTHPENTPATITVACSTPLGTMIADTGEKIGFLGTTPISKPTPVGACGGSSGCQALRDALGALGLINTGSISN